MQLWCAVRYSWFIGQRVKEPKMNTTVTYRKTNTGEWVVYGPTTRVKTGPVTVTKADGTTKTEHVIKTGKVFVAGGAYMVYGYLAKNAPRTTGYSKSPRGGCVTGGQCSSFGTGRSCGGYDCDGH